MDRYVALKKNKQKIGVLESVVMTTMTPSPPQTLPPLLPNPYPQSYKHQPPAYCDPAHIQSRAQDTTIKTTS